MSSQSLFAYNSSSYQRRQWHPTPVLLPGKSRGQRSLVGCSPWGREESDMAERLHFHFSCIREGNGNPLQCSCPESPREGGAWWATVYGVAQNWKRLKWLSSSTSFIIVLWYTSVCEKCPLIIIWKSPNAQFNDWRKEEDYRWQINWFVNFKVMYLA